MAKEDKTYIAILDEILPIEFILKSLKEEIEKNTPNKMKALELAMKARGIDRRTPEEVLHDERFGFM